MMMPVRRNAGWWFLGLVVIIVASGLVWSIVRFPKIAPFLVTASGAITALFTGVAAYASLVAAMAARDAALQSDKTAERASHALGLAISAAIEAKLTMADDGLEDGRYTKRVAHLTLSNSSRWGAKDVRITIVPNYFDRQDPYTLPHLAPSESKMIDVLELPRHPRIKDPEWASPLEWDTKLTVSYSDEQGFLRWETDCTVTFSIFRIEPQPHGYLGEYLWNIEHCTSMSPARRIEN